MRYKIHELSAMAIMNFAKENEDGSFSYNLNEDATGKCISFSAPTTQDDCALYYQTMSVLHGDNFKIPTDDVIADLADVICNIDFSGIFDRTDPRKKYTDRQKQAKAMFSPKGITFDFGKQSYRYVAFERSANMSRDSKLSFIREDFYTPVRHRIMLDMQVGTTELSKLYAYNGLMLTSGFRINDTSIFNKNRIVIVDNPTTIVKNINIITAEDDGSDNAVRAYHRVEKTADIDICEFDGEGFISKEFADKIDREFCGNHIHTSFQIRMPYIKGVVHEVDIKSLFAEFSVPYIIDIWGVKHPINEIDLILSKSMFKAFGWLKENNLTFLDYLTRCKKFNHALYISGESQVEEENHTEFNYQFLSTVSMKADEFHPADLPHGWIDSPENDNRHWITKQTEIAYYNFTANMEFRTQYFLQHLSGTKYEDNTIVANLIAKNPLFINEPYFGGELDSKGKKILKNYSLGKLIIAGDNRYFSGDLMRFIGALIKSVSDVDSRFLPIVSILENECFKDETCFYAPKPTYELNREYSLLRNPHIARNEEAMVAPPTYIGPLREKHLSHLNYVIMVDSRTLIPERLGGADFDGDMIKTIADPLLNECVSRNYKYNDNDAYNPNSNIPLIKIPSAIPIMRDANDWEDCFETIKSTFSTRIGQICNAAFNRSMVAYDENSNSEQREKLQYQTEMLEILTGLEIDSVKSGIKPDLSDILGNNEVARSPFLKYKDIVGEDDNHKWYEPTKKKKLDKYFESISWDKVTSNVEQLPYLAKMLEENTPKTATKPAKDEELFTFACEPNWKEKLDPENLQYMKELIADYEEATRRIRSSWHIKSGKRNRQSDIERILFMRGQENDFTPDELYNLWSNYNASWMAGLRKELTKQRWHFMTKEERQVFLYAILPHGTPQIYYDFFADFRHCGHRILGDIICDLDDILSKDENNKARLHRMGDSTGLKILLTQFEQNMHTKDYEEALTSYCRKVSKLHLSYDDALKCAVALGKRKFAYQTYLTQVEQNAVTRGQ